MGPLFLAGMLLFSPQEAPAGVQETQPIEVRVPRMAHATAQLAHARELKRSMQRRPIPDRGFWRRLAVEAYFAVGHYHPGEPAIVAEAYFRAGELLRAQGAGKEARDAFRKAVQAGRKTVFRARGLLELGHMERREKRHRLALDAYLEVAADPRASALHRDDAWLWAGRVWIADGRMEDARRAWRSVAEKGADPLDRVLAYDYLAMSYLKSGDPEAAAGVLNEGLRDLAPVALEETEAGERVRKSLQRMRVLDALQDVVREREADRFEVDAAADRAESGSRPKAGRPRKP